MYIFAFYMSPEENEISICKQVEWWKKDKWNHVIKNIQSYQKWKKRSSKMMFKLLKWLTYWQQNLPGIFFLWHCWRKFSKRLSYLPLSSLCCYSKGLPTRHSYNQNQRDCPQTEGSPLKALYVIIIIIFIKYSDLELTLKNPNWIQWT